MADKKTTFSTFCRAIKFWAFHPHSYFWQKIIKCFINEKLNFKSQNFNECTYLKNRRGIDQEVKFHEIEIHFFMRSKLFLFMRSNLFNNIWQVWSGGRHFDHEIEIPKSIIRNFDLMIVLVANKSIMRSKFKKDY